MNFYNNNEAAAAIAAEIHPNDLSKQESVAGQYWHLIYDALLAGRLVGRDADARIPIDPSRDGRALIFRSCLISEADLNRWLDGIGVGVVLAAAEDTQPASMPSASPSDLPSTAKLARDFGPFLSNGKDADWLRKVLGDLRSRPELARFRTLTSRPKGSLWRPAGVAIWLVKNKYMSNNAARAALRDNYPDDEAYLP